MIYRVINFAQHMIKLIGEAFYQGEKSCSFLWFRECTVIFFNIFRISCAAPESEGEIQQEKDTNSKIYVQGERLQERL